MEGAYIRHGLSYSVCPSPWVHLNEGVRRILFDTLYLFVVLIQNIGKTLDGGAILISVPL